MSFSSHFPSIFNWQDYSTTCMVAISTNLIILTMLFSKVGFVYLFTNFMLCFIISSIIFIKSNDFINDKKDQYIDQNSNFEFVDNNQVKEFISRLFSLNQLVIRELQSLTEKADDISYILKYTSIVISLWLVSKLFTFTFLFWIVFNMIITLNYLDHNKIMTVNQKIFQPLNEQLDTFLNTKKKQ